MRVKTWRWLRGLFLTGLLGSLLVYSQWRSDLPLETLKTRWATPPSQFVDVDGMSVHYRDEGSGPVLMLLHGTGASLQTWDGWSSELVKSGWRVIRPDLPGFGLTGPEPHGDYRTPKYAVFLDHFASKLSLDRFALGGNSLGGLIAWRYAVAQPQRLTALILVDAAGYPTKRSPPLVFRLAKLPLLPALLTNFDPRWMVRGTLRSTYGDPSRVSEALIDRYTDMALRPGNRASFVRRASLSYEDRTDELHSLRVPTLVIWGKKDSLIPVTVATRFAADIPGATLQVYDDLGHVPMEEDSARTAADLKQFLTRIHP